MSAKTQSILSYLGLLFWLIGYFGGKSERNRFSVFHVRQGLGLIIFFVAVSNNLGLFAAILPKIGGFFVLVFPFLCWF